MSGRLLQSDPVTKIRRTFYTDHDGAECVLHTEFDPTDVFEMNKARRALVNEKTHRLGEEFHLEASIPLPVLFQWEQEWRDRGLSEHEKEKDLCRKLDDRDNLFMRSGVRRLSK